MTVVFVVFGLYYAIVLVLLFGWRKAVQRDFPIHRRHFKISVIVPFRNEERSIAGVIRNLIIQTYNHQYFEVLLCNDHSTDSSVQKVQEAITGLPNFKLVSVSGNGKKAALMEGIALATGEVIVTTDADCNIPENWLARFNHAFQDPAISMVFGGVAIRPQKTFFSGLQAMEFSSVVGSAGAAAGLGHPILCNGANLAFLRATFDEVDGYAGNLNIPSGDDEFLMRKVEGRYPHGIAFLNTEDSVVSTQPQITLAAFISQRIRWAGKWRYNASVAAKATALFVLLFQLFFSGLVVATLADFSIAPTTGIIIGVKLLLEFAFLYQCGAFLGLRWKTFHFITLQFIYPAYVIFIGIASNFMSYEWKGRKWGHSQA